MKMKEKRKKHQKCEWLGKALGKKCGVSQILKDEHGRHREGNSGHREEDTHGHTGAECVKHYKLGLGTGHRKGAGGGEVSRIPIPTCLGNHISSSDCTHASGHQRKLSQRVT